jgi:phosphatidylserine synthase
MKRNKLKMKSTERLKSELSGLKIITGTLVIILTVLFTVNLYGLLSKENNTVFIAGMTVAVSLCAILPSQFMSMKKIKTELKLR